MRRSTWKNDGKKYSKRAEKIGGHQQKNNLKKEVKKLSMKKKLIK